MQKHGYLEKMQQKNNKQVPDELKFYRWRIKLINELPKWQQDILLNWPGLQDLNKRINEN